MRSVASYLLRFLGTGLLAIATVACSSSDNTATDAAWGSESLAFFEELSFRHEDGDIYGVLDFYAITAEIDKSRGELSGPARVSDRIRWNSGDLIHETLTVNVAAGGALNIVRWASNDELGAVLSGIHESRYRDVESFSRCVPEPEATGWWTGLELPKASDTVITGVLATSQVRKLTSTTVRNA